MAGLEPATSRVSGEVTVVFTTGRIKLSDSPGNQREEPTRGAISFRYFLIRDYAPVPEALILGRTAVLRVVIVGAKYLFSSPPAKFKLKRSGNMRTRNGLAPLGIRTPQPEGCSTGRSIRGLSPLTLCDPSQTSLRISARGSRRVIASS